MKSIITKSAITAISVAAVMSAAAPASAGTAEASSTTPNAGILADYCGGGAPPEWSTPRGLYAATSRAGACGRCMDTGRDLQRQGKIGAFSCVYHDYDAPTTHYARLWYK